MSEFNFSQNRIDRSNLGLKTRYQRQQRSLNAMLQVQRQADQEMIVLGKRTSSELERHQNTLAEQNTDPQTK